MSMSRGAAEAFLEMKEGDRLKLLRSMSENERWEVLGLLANALVSEEEELAEEVFPLAA